MTSAATATSATELEEEDVYGLGSRCRERSAKSVPYLLALTGLAVMVGSALPMIRIRTQGLLASFLLGVPELDRSYSLISLGTSVVAGNPGDWGAHFTQDVFLAFNFFIPLALLGMLAVLWMAPMRRSWQTRILSTCRAMHTWASIDVFILAVVIMRFELAMLANYLVYYDNVSTMCGLVKEYLEDECLHLEVEFAPGVCVLVIAGLAMHFVPKAAFCHCAAALEAADHDVDSSESSATEEAYEDGASSPEE